MTVSKPLCGCSPTPRGYQLSQIALGPHNPEEETGSLYYVKVVDHGGFASARRTLGIPKSKLSRRITLLEDRLEVRLIQRSTRRFSVTEIGQNYYEHYKAMLVEAEAAQEYIDFTRAKPCGTVRLTCPPALLHAHVGKMLADFMALNPFVAIHLEPSNRRVDPVGEGIDLAIRVRHPPMRAVIWSCAFSRIVGNV